MDNVSKLLIHGLPVIRTLNDFSDITHISKDTLFKFSSNSKFYYKTYFIPKKSGRSRLISQPSRGLKALQAWILRNILDKLYTSQHSFGFEKNGSSTYNNALAHSGANALLLMDLKDFFHSIKVNHVYSIFKDIGYNSYVSSLLAKICTHNGKLPQGSPCSPKLANIFCLNLDNRIQNYISKRGLTYTRYADDLSISASMPQKLSGITYTLEKIIKSENLTVNTRKTRLLGPKQRKQVTGLVLYDDKVGIGKQQYKILRVKIHKIAVAVVTPEVVNHVNGWLAYIKKVDNLRHKRLKAYCSELTKKYPKSALVDLRF